MTLATIAGERVMVRVIERHEGPGYSRRHAYLCRLPGSGRRRIVDADRLLLLNVGLVASSSCGADCSRRGEGCPRGQGGGGPLA